MSYQVFARKYRPQTFADVLGQDHVVRTLRNAIEQDRLAHAYLFVGPRGTGKTSTARIFAKALNCSNGPSVEFDPDEDICREIAEGRSLDVLEIDGASNNSVDQVRELRDNVKFAPARCRYKIYYIDEVHMLSTAAFNALLKTLEEPPEHVKFIFATTEPNKILPTIISRCQRFDLRRIPAPLIAEHLLYIAKKEGVDLAEPAAFAIAKGADGGMRDAQSMLDQLVAFCGNRIEEENVLEIFGFTSAETVALLAGCLLTSDTVNALRVVHDQSEGGKDLGRLLADLIQHLRTLLVYQADPEAVQEELSPELLQMVVEQAVLGSASQLLRMVDGLAEVDARMRWAANKRLHFELGVIQSIQQFNEVSLDDVIHALDQGGAGGGSAAVRTAPPRPQPETIARRAAAPPAKPAESSSGGIGLRAMIAESAEPEGSLPPRASSPPPAAKPAEPEPVAVPESAVDEQAFWPVFLKEVNERRPLTQNWLRVATLLAIENNIVKLGFPKSEAPAMASLMRDSTRPWLEEVAFGLLGRKISFNMAVDATLPDPVFSEMAFGVAEPEPVATPAKAVQVAPVPAPEDAAAAKSASEEAFYQDPLIKRAVERFKLTLIDNPQS